MEIMVSMLKRCQKGAMIGSWLIKLELREEELHAVFCLSQLLIAPFRNLK